MHLQFAHYDKYDYHLRIETIAKQYFFLAVCVWVCVSTRGTIWNMYQYKIFMGARFGGQLR